MSDLANNMRYLPVSILGNNGERLESASESCLSASSSDESFLVTGKHPLLREASSIAIEVQLSACVGECVFYCNFWDRELKNKIVKMIGGGSQRSVYEVDVPEGTYCVELGIRLRAGSEAEVEQIRCSGVSGAGLSISMDTYRLAQNETAARFENRYKQLVEMIPESNGGSFYPQSSATVGIITDDFMYNYYADAVNLIYLEPERFDEQLRSGGIDFVLYVSCWRGLNPPDENGEYEYAPNEAHALTIVPEIFSLAKDLGIKTVFQTIEDPPSYQLYLPIAKVADYIFTSCVEKIPDYVKDTGNENVFFLGYGVNPLFHNPVGICKKYEIEERFYEDSVFFAGSWYSTFPERCKDTKLLFDGAIDVFGKNLILADRALDYANRNIREFPYYYNEFIIAPIEHRFLQQVHKLFNYSINLNSIKDSQTMGAMRVFEVQALGCLLISNYAQSIENFFPSIPMILDETDYSSLPQPDDVGAMLGMQLEGVRKVMSNYTVYDRLNWIFEHIGLSFKYEDAPIYVAISGDDPTIEESFLDQTYARKELIPLDEASRLPREGYLVVADRPLPTTNTLQDIANAFKYVDVDFVCCDVLGDGGPYGAFDYCRSAMGDGQVAFALNHVSAAEALSSGKKYEGRGFRILTS